MKALKLLGIFIAFVGILILALNWNALFHGDEIVRLTEENDVLTAKVDSFVTVVNSMNADSQNLRQKREDETGTVQTTATENGTIVTNQNTKKEQKLKELLDKINAKTFTTFSLNGGDYKQYFTTQQQARIEAVTNPAQYDNYVDQKTKLKLKPQIGRKIKNEIKKKWPKGGFATFDEIYKFREDVIMPYINNKDNFY